MDLSGDTLVLVFLTTGFTVGFGHCIGMCGPVYTVLIASARAGMEAPDGYSGFIKGMVLMLAFGIGTIPALFAVGRLAGAGWFKKRRLLYKAGSVIMVGVGIYFVIKGVRY